MSKNEGTTEELLLRVAWFYYKDELTHDEIAKRLSVSRESVGRMLDRARKVGLVSINLNADHLNAFEVSRQLRRVFGLAEALVVPDHASGEGSRPVLNARLGLGGAQLMSTHLRPDGTLGVGWGGYGVPRRRRDPLRRGQPDPDGVADRRDGRVPAGLPVVQGRGRGDQCDGHPNPDRRVHPRTGHGAEGGAVHPAGAQAGLRRRAGDRRSRHADRGRHHRADGLPEALDVRELGHHHVVGDILGQFFDASGRVVPLPIHDRRIGIELSELTQIPKVVGVAGGLRKAEAILGALRGGFLDVLVTNELAALRLLELDLATAR